MPAVFCWAVGHTALCLGLHLAGLVPLPPGFSVGHAGLRMNLVITGHNWLRYNW